MSIRIFTDITISGQHTDLTVGTTYTINCTVPGLEDSEITALWTMSTDPSSVQVSANTLTLQSVDSTLNGTVFTCSVNSLRLYSSGMKKITVTIQSMSDKFSMFNLNLLNFAKDTSVTMVSIKPQNVTALVGTPPVVFTCTITLNHAIGPDHSALTVNWTQDTMSVNSSATPETGVHSVFDSSMTISTLTSSSRKEYCCNVRVVGTNAVSNCSSIEVLGKKNHSLFMSRKVYLLQKLSSLGNINKSNWATHLLLSAVYHS